MHTTQIELTQQEADALELAYPMHETVLDLINRAEAKYGVTAQEKAAILAMPCMNVDCCGGVA